MKKELTEQQVLNMLDIPDFRHMSKDKIMSFTSMLPDMDPRVAVMALQQFPEFAKTSIDIMSCYKEMTGKALDENAVSTKSFYDSCDILIDSLKMLLEKDDLSFEEKNTVIDRMMQVLKMKGDKDTENKKFHWAVIGALSLATATVVAILASVLGTNTEVNDSNPDSQN